MNVADGYLPEEELRKEGEVRSVAKVVLLLVMVAVLFGCARGRVFVLGVSYIKEAEPPTPPPGTRPISMAVATFDDGRPVKDRIGIRRAYGETPDIFQPAAVALDELFAQSLASQLRKAGITTQVIPRWDLTRATIPRIPQEYILGGRITSVWADVNTSIGGSKTRIRVEFELALASVKERRLLWRNVVTSSRQFRDPFYMRGRVERALNEVLSNAVNRVLYNTDLQTVIWGQPIPVPPRREGG